MLFLFIAAAVAAFLSCSFKNAPYAFLDKEPFDTEYGVTGMVSERQRQYKSTYARCNMVGTMLCILSPVPIFIGMAEGSDLAMILAVCGMLFLAGGGAAVFVVTGVRWASMQKILQSGDYAPAEKKRNQKEEALSAAYWTLAFANFCFLICGVSSFFSHYHSLHFFFFLFFFCDVLSASGNSQVQQ